MFFLRNRPATIIEKYTSSLLDHCELEDWCYYIGEGEQIITTYWSTYRLLQGQLL